MPHEEAMNSELESALRSLQPQSVQLDAAHAAFAAGKRTGRHQVRLWQSAAALFLLTSIGPWLLPRAAAPLPNSAPIAQMRTVPYRPSPSMSDPISQLSLVRLQQAVDKQGLSGLPETSIPAAGPIRIDGL